MSNSEYIEELMHQANEKGFFNKMHPKVEEIIKYNTTISKSDAYYRAYQILQEEHSNIRPIESSDFGDVDFIDGVDMFRQSNDQQSMNDDSWDY